MATGDAGDFASRIRSYLPGGWFADPANTPILNAVLVGIGAMFAAVWTQLQYLRLQTRIKSASDTFLDIIALDFFGARVARQTNQSDASFLAKILIELFRERATRAGLIKVLQDLTGRTPIVFNPARAADAFCLGVPSQGGLGVGRLGSYSMPGEILVTAFRPLGQGIPNVAGLGSTYAGLRASFMALPDPSSALNAVTDAAIYAAVDGNRAVPIIDWVNIQS